MTRNPAQFQRGLSLPIFLERYGTDAQCRNAIRISMPPLGR